MDIFGERWEDHWDKILDNARALVGEEDLLLIAGDTSWAMTLEKARADLDLLPLLPGKKVIIRGNHDYWWSSYSKVKAALPQGVFALQNNALKFGDVIVCGSRGWGERESEEDRKIYARELIRMRMSLDEGNKLKEKEDKLVVLTHYPPFSDKYKASPFTDLYAEYGVSAVVYGHLHGAGTNAKRVVRLDGITYYLTSCDMLRNIPLKIDL